ncbi:MAG: HAD family hydrolase, partial [Candidatus Micrarchaeia archaeon]
DGTLVDKNFDDALWFKEIPKLYAEKHNVSFEQALEKCKFEYDSLGDKNLNWYDVFFWFEKFALKKSPREVSRDLSHLIELYSDAIPTLEYLTRNGFGLVVVSNASRHFLELKVSLEKIDKYFSKMFSVTSDFKAVKKSEDVYLKVCKELGVKPAELVHVGDHKEFDFNVPKKVGINAFYLDRKAKVPGEGVIASLSQLRDLF